MNIPAIELNDGTRIPQLGFGVFQIEANETASAVRTALEIGYRHI
ncbi:MAG TPA: aldo/keto reductase, partial [Mycobacterium sp.]